MEKPKQPPKGRSTSKGSSPDRGRDGGSARQVGPAKAVRLNLRALIIVGVLVLLLFPGLYLIKVYQDRASRTNILKEAKSSLAAGRADLAISYLNRFLTLEPDSLEALDLKSKILSDAAREENGYNEAIKAHSQLLSRLKDPGDPAYFGSRKRLIELQLRSQRYRAAEASAQELLKFAPDDPEVFRLMARALEGSGSLAQGETKDLENAVRFYEKAEAKKPGDILGGERLAQLYRTRFNDIKQASRIMDDVLRYNPKSAPARLARYRFFLSLNEPAAVEKAMREVDEAIRLAPKELETRLVAAETAAQRGDTKAARLHLQQIDPKPVNDLRVKLVEGLIELNESKIDDAIQSWRSGLVMTGGNDAELTWRLAHVLLQLGRVKDAEPLISQYRRLVGGEEPSPEYRYLVALVYLKQARTGDAIKELEAIRYKIDKAIEGQLYFALGQCYEISRDVPKALDAYGQACSKPGVGATPWLARVRVLLADRPDDALRTLQEALVAVPNDPRLLAAQAQILWQRELETPPNQRNWNEVERVLAQGRRVAPESVELTLIQADYYASVGKLEDGLKLLEAACRQNPTAAGLWLARINGLGRLGRADDALKVLGEAVQKCGELAIFRTTKAYLHTVKGESRLARAALVEGLDRVPQDQKAAIWKALGEYYRNLRDNANARKAFSEWARLSPDSADARLALLNLAIASGDENQIKGELNSLKALNGERSNFYKIALAEALLRDRPKGGPIPPADIEAADELIRSIKQALPQQPAGYLLEGKLEEKRKRFDRAIDAFEQAIEKQGGQIALRPLVALLTQQRKFEELDALRAKMKRLPVDIERLAGAMALQIGDSDRAEQMAMRLVQGDPRSLDARVWQASVLATAGRSKEAEKTLVLLTEQRPEEPSPWLQLFMFQVNQKNLAAAAVTVENMKKSVKTDRPELLWAVCYRVLGRRNLADEAFAAALQKWPDDTRVRQGAIDYYEQTGRLDLAEQSLRHVLKAQPNLDWARKRLALNLSARSNDFNSWSEALSLVGASPDSTETPDDRLLRATILSRSVEPRYRQEAIQILESLASELPGSLKLHEILARLYLAANEPSKARENAMLAAGEDATPDGILLHSSLLLDDKNFDEAEKQLIRLKAIDPEALPTIELEARLLKARGKGTEAVTLVDKAFASRERSSDAVTVGQGVVKLLVALEEFPAAERIARRLAEMSGRGKIILAEFLGLRGKLKEAAEVYRQAAAQGETRDAVKSAIGLASGEFASNDEWLGQADGLLSLALQGQPDSSELLQARAYLRHLQRKFDEEIKLYDQVMAKNPSTYIFLNNWAWTLSEELAKPEEGLKRVSEAIEKIGKQPHILDTRGVILLRLGRTEEAIADLEIAAGAVPSATIYFHLARAYEKAGRKDDFAKYREKAKELKLKPDQLQPSERAEYDRMFKPASTTAVDGEGNPPRDGLARAAGR